MYNYYPVFRVEVVDANVSNSLVAKMSLAPANGRMKETEVDAGFDEEGNVVGKQMVWIYDPADVTPGDKIVLEPIEEGEDM